MSLFGTSPDTAPHSALKSGLFEENTSSGRRQQSSGLFSEDTVTADDSPWGFQPTPKKQAHSNLVKTLLPATEVPELYIDTFDALLHSGDREGNGVSFAGADKLLRGSAVTEPQRRAILNIVAPQGQSTGQGLGRGEFNVLLALIGLAQENEEVSLDGVDDRRRRLPLPSLPKISRPKPAQPEAPPPRPTSSDAPATPTKAPSNVRPQSQQRARNSSFGFPDTDPWATSPVNNKSNGGANGLAANMPGRTTSTFTTTADDTTGGAPQQSTSDQTPSSSVAGDWGYGSTAVSTFGAGSIEGGFGDGGGDDGRLPPVRPSKPPASSARAAQGAEEEVTVSALPEKQGTLLFQYRNYEVTTKRRNSKVVRRYSDFVWLLDCLHKKFPFRQLPLLPPKRVAINGNHIAADIMFIEKRRRGLARFANALVRHPVLSQEQLVVMFLTVPTELSVWRKQATITVQEEFTGKPLPQGLEDSLLPTLDDLFDTVRSGVRRSSEVYINICSMFERVIKRQEGLAGEYSRLSAALASATETSADTYRMDTNDVPLLNEGINSTAKHIGISQTMLLDEARTLDEGALEDFKRQRDSLVSMRDMFDRRDRFAKDTIPACEKRIAANESKLSAVRQKPEGQRKAGEAEKLEDAIMKDKESIIAQHARGVFIMECVRDEIQFFQSTQYQIARMHQDWSSDKSRFADQQADCWRELSEQLEGMPVGE